MVDYGVVVFWDVVVEVDCVIGVEGFVFDIEMV